MSNYPNMSYCMNENTLAAMRQVLNAMEEERTGFLRHLSRDELAAFQSLFNACERFLNLAEELQGEADIDDSMDGDHDSAMASAGWGTDEDYGG